MMLEHAEVRKMSEKCGRICHESITKISMCALEHRDHQIVLVFGLLEKGRLCPRFSRSHDESERGKLGQAQSPT